jgi:hypothetical protein
MPASINEAIIFGVEVAGPSVQTILVRRVMAGCSEFRRGGGTPAPDAQCGPTD